MAGTAPSFEVVRLTPAHAVRYRALMLAAYARHAEAFTSSANERAALPLSWWKERVAVGHDAHVAAFGALEGDQLCGVVGLSVDPREKARHKARLFGMYVRETHRGQGLARALLEAALAEARRRPGVVLAQLSVTKGNTAAQQLYTSAGFEPFGVEPQAVKVGAGFVAKVHMWRDVTRVG